MKKLFVLAAVLTGFFVTGREAQAALASWVDSSFSLDGLGTVGAKTVFPSAPLYRIAKNAVSNLQTSLKMWNGYVLQRGSTIYFTDSTGIRKQAIGASSSSLLKGGKEYIAVRHTSDKLIVQKAKTSQQKAGSFVYSVKTGSVKAFQPTLGTLTSSDITSDEKRIAILSKNAEGKEKIFLSEDEALTKLKGNKLPRYATSCSFVSISPSGAYLQVGCTFDEPNKTKGRKGWVLLGRKSDNTLSELQRSVTNTTLIISRWLSETRLVSVAENGTTKIAQLVESILNNGRVVAKTTLATGSATTIDDGVVTAGPLLVTKISATEFLSNTLTASLSLSTGISFTGAITYYNRSAKTSSTVVDDGKFWVLIDP